jgi:dolichol-phosphate mannosyltransferase
MIAVVIPCYKVKEKISGVLAGIGPEADRIYVVDDACPQKSGDFVKTSFHDPRIEVLFHKKNQGVGGATMTGYRKALEDGASVVVKIDGDGQMDPSLIRNFIDPLLKNHADYVKGNRFYDLRFLRKMPNSRKFGNAILSFINKLVSGYWNIMDPTNGYTAINAVSLRNLPLEKIDKRFFFESDMLVRLNTIRAVVMDLPMHAEYGTEKSNLKISGVLLRFPFKICNRFWKRIFYNYFFRDFNIGSIELILAFILLSFGLVFGIFRWIISIETAQPATAGTVLLAGLPIILGFQSLINFLHFDISSVPQKPISTYNP